MTKQITVGIINTLTIDRSSEHGLYLTDSIGESVLLPGIYVEDHMQIGDSIDVFVYTDSEDRIVASTLLPLAKRGEFALMEVKDIAPFGAFADWGLPKELLIPRAMQKHPLKKGERYIIHVTYDPDTDRMIGDTRIGRYLVPAPKTLAKNHTFDMLVVARTPMGYKVIADNRYEGMLYHNEIFETLRTGMQKRGYLKHVREDGKLDLSLQPIGAAKTDIAIQKVYDTLQRHGGTLPFTYKSDADTIAAQFGISKKAFKKALTTLIEAGKIKLTDDAIILQEPHA